MRSRAHAEATLGRLLGKLRRTLRRWRMLEPGEPVAIGVSGGHDSLALVTLLAAHNRVVDRPHALTGLHVPLAAEGEGPPLAEPIRRWCAAQGVELDEVPARLDPSEELPMGCFRCARVRRRTLLEEAAGRGVRVLALGHHADDVVETWLLGLMYNGRSETLAPVRRYFADAVRVVRPLYEIRRPEIRRLAARCAFPDPPPKCPRETEHARRNRVEAALAALGPDQRTVRRQLYWAAVRGLPDEVEGKGP